ncbi:epsin-1-like isoform X2 [Zophobas morio]|uniref:epsin-1-like isoform X2 n=1 Tax=Zophobas morio TaxID=2755281 RepID=UPI003083C030
MKKVVDFTGKKSEIERKVRKATSNKSHTPLRSQLVEIAWGTYDNYQLPCIMKAIWKRLDEPRKHWRHIYKALHLLDFILKHGSYNAVRSAIENIYKITTLREFTLAEKNVDLGENIRLKAKNIVWLLTNQDELKKERDTLKKERKKIKETYGLYEAQFRSADLHLQPRSRRKSLEEEQLRKALDESKKEYEEQKNREQKTDSFDQDLQTALILSRLEHMKSQRSCSANNSLSDFLHNAAVSNPQDSPKRLSQTEDLIDLSSFCDHEKPMPATSLEAWNRSAYSMAGLPQESGKSTSSSSSTSLDTTTWGVGKSMQWGLADSSGERREEEDEFTAISSSGRLSSHHPVCVTLFLENVICLFPSLSLRHWRFARIFPGVPLRTRYYGQRGPRTLLTSTHFGPPLVAVPSGGIPSLSTPATPQTLVLIKTHF